MSRRKRQPIYQTPLPAGRYVPILNHSPHDQMRDADRMKARLLSEADFLTAIGDSRGERFRSAILELPWSSFTRM